MSVCVRTRRRGSQTVERRNRVRSWRVFADQAVIAIGKRTPLSRNLVASARASFNFLLEEEMLTPLVQYCRRTVELLLTGSAGGFLDSTSGYAVNLSKSDGCKESL